MNHDAHTQGRIDLHTHTTASDGLLSPSELVRDAVRQGVRYLGIADHDTTAGLAEAIDEAARHQAITVVPAVELSATSASGGDFHLLGYCIEPSGSPLQRELDRFRRSREDRIERIVLRLQENGIPVTLEHVMEKAAGGAVSRAHVGRVLMDLGVVDSIDEAFSRWLGRNRPAFVPREPLFARDAVNLVLSSGGVPVLAHPLTMGVYRTQLPELVDAGLRGIEVYYGPYTLDQREELRTSATKYGLIMTGGSDYHGPEHREGRNLGGVDVPHDVIDDLRNLAPDCL